MKIFKILFLGIVLVVFNLAYLAAATLPDTITVKSALAKPGGVLKVTVGVSYHSAATGGFLALINGLPSELAQTALDTLGASGVLPTAPGACWYEWTGIGKLYKDKKRALNMFVKLDDAIDGKTKILSVNVIGVDIDTWESLGSGANYIPKTGDVANVYFNVPSDMTEGTYELTPDSTGILIYKFPVEEGYFSDKPVVTAESITIANIPDYDALQLVASQGGLSGKTVNMSVKVENKDVIGSGSFKITYPSSTLSLKGVAKGTRSGGMTFTISSIALAAAGDSTATISFSGGSISAGGLADLCVLQFTAAKVSSGSSANVSLSNVVLKDAVGTALAALQQPTTGTTGISFFYGDTLFIDVKSGVHQPGTADETSGISVIQNGKLYLPIRIKNSVPLTVVRLYIKEEAGKEDILSFSEIQGSTRTSSFNASVADSGSYIQVIAFAGTILSPVPAGDGVVCTVIYDTHTTGVQLPVDINLTVVGVEIYDNTGLSVGMEKVNGVATIDFRVPENNENVGPGATLPKAFALAQNHPNPFNPSTTVNYQIPDGVSAVSFTLNVFDIRGRLIKTLASGIKGPGYYSAFWDGSDQNGQKVSSGIYFYRFTSADYTQTRKMVLLK